MNAPDFHKFPYLLVLVCSILLTSIQCHAEKNEGKENIYHEGWIDFNKNGKKDVYEDSGSKIDDRVEDLISQMNLDEKVCQMVTLYGFGRVCKDELPTEDWKNTLWKDGIGNIDEHLNNLAYHPAAVTKLAWPPSNHIKALNKVQK
ncbi:MAG: hypothetical protein MI740_15740, partial [Halanaerobiales bacterium]|nr:hypothetical protein [Halanaerobiales bacterium]